MPDMTENPYTPPQAELEAPASAYSKPHGVPLKMYSPGQIRVGTFCGGPLAAIYFLKSNFDEMQEERLSKRTLLLGFGFCIFLLVLSLFLPKAFPKVAIPITYSYLAGHLAETYQMNKTAIIESDHFSTQSNWKVAGVSLIALVAFLIVMVAVLLALNSLGLVHPA